MADIAQANWNVVQVVFGPSRNPSQLLPNKKRTFFPLDSIYGNPHQQTYLGATFVGKTYGNLQKL
jgi:hypothetical protein